MKGLKDVEVRLHRIDDLRYLENVIGYILRNPMAAGIKVLPYLYPWSSASLYFNPQIIIGGEVLNEMSERKRFRILKSRTSVPDNYMVDSNGMILPSCYVDYAAVEKIFRHPARLLAALARNVENDVEIFLGVADEVSMTDQEILSQMKELIWVEFHRDSISQLSMEQRVRLCRLLKLNFKAGVKQIARVTHIDPDLVARVL